MRRVFPLVLMVLAAGPASPSAARGDADDKAIRAVAERYFAAYASKDLDAFMALWSEKSPDYEAYKKTMTGLFAATGPIELKSLAVVRVRRDGDAASVRVRVQLSGNNLKTGKPHALLGRLDRVLDLAREGDSWKAMRYGPSDVWLMERLAETKSKGEWLRLLDADTDLIGRDFVMMVLDKGNAQAGRGRFDQAMVLQSVAFEMARGLGDKDVLACCLLYRGLSLKLQSRNEPALASYRDALALFRDVNDREGEASALHNIGIIYEATSRYEEALQQYQDCLKIDRELPDRKGEGQDLRQIGVVYKSTGRYAEALRQYQDALKIDRELPDRKGEAIALGNIGLVYQETGRYTEALKQHQDSLKIRRELGDRKGMAITFANIGLVYGSMGRYGEALQQLRDALKIVRDLGDRDEEAVALIGIGAVYASTGRYPEALRQYQDALKIVRDLGDHSEESIALRNMGNIYNSMGEYGEALRQYQDALKIVRDLGDRPAEASILEGIGGVYQNTERYAEALQQCEAALKIVRDLDDRSGEAIALRNIGNIYRLTGKYGDALKRLKEALQIAETFGLRREGGNCYHVLGMVHEAQGQWRQAAQADREAVRVTELLRSDSREPSLQYSLLAQMTDPFFRLAVCMLELGQSAEAFEAGEQMKARGLVDILRDGKADLRRGMNDDERKEEQRLQDRTTALAVQLEDRRGRKANAQAVAALVGDLDKARETLEAFRRDLYLHRPDLEARRAEFTPASLDDLGHSLFAGRPGLVVLSYLVGNDETILFVLTAGERDGGPARLSVHRIDVTAKDLADAVNTCRDACRNPYVAPVSEDLCRWLIAPAAGELADAKQLVIVPDGVLHTLPFQALRPDSEDQYLIERIAVSYAPSVTALVKMETLGAGRRMQYAGKPATLLAIGLSHFRGREEESRPLAAAEPEAEAVAGLFGAGGRTLLAADATRAKVEAAWGASRYLHFATHGRLNADAPLYSSLVLSPADANDVGVLYAQELVNADVPAELAVMSACETGLGRRMDGEGLLGLTWSWFAAGVPSTVASQWSVGDASTVRLMKAFYTRLAAGDSKTDALRQAELTLLKDDATRSPFYWAPFVLVGDDR